MISIDKILRLELAEIIYNPSRLCYNEYNIFTIERSNMGGYMNIVDLHCDTLDCLLKDKLSGVHYNLYRRSGHLDLERMVENDYLVQVFAGFINLGEVESAYERGKQYVNLFKQLCAEYSPYIAPVYFFRDIEANQKRGQMSAILAIEDGSVLEGSLERLQEFYIDGVRLITLTWNHPNEIGFPAGSTEGLTEKGKDIVEMMQQEGIIVDVSHLSDAGFWDVDAIMQKPFVASHSNARSICNHKRNLTDEQIKAIANKGGVIGLNYYDAFLEADKSKLSIESFLRHIQHILNVGGEDVLALGSDFDGIDTNPVLPHAGELNRLFEAIERSEITPKIIDKIKGENALRMMREVLK